MNNELIKSLASLFERDLAKLGLEINQYQNTEDLWRIEGDIKNSAGNLCLHLCGNIQHFIGAILGQSGYERDRDNEFSAKGLSREQLLAQVSTTREVVGSTLSKLDADSLTATYPIEVFGRPMSTLYFLIHLQGHLNYHLGQINYHRRLVVPG